MSADVAASRPQPSPAPAPTTKRPWKGGGGEGGRGGLQKPHRKKQKRETGATRSEGTHDEVLHAELRALSLSKESSTSQAAEQHQQQEQPVQEHQTQQNTLPEPFTEIDVEIHKLSSTGDGIGYAESSANHPYIVPFTLPGDKVRAKVIRHIRDPLTPTYTVADFVSVLRPSADRDDSLVGCKYFSVCSGCQFQMAPYEFQLRHKRDIVVNAYKRFSGLPDSLVPAARDTLPSPLKYGYRTKLTPHFDGPPGSRRKNRNGNMPRFESVPPIGFMKKGTRHTLDIEECPIGTEAVQHGLKRERSKVVEKLDTYHKGVTILLRESSRRREDGTLEKTCISDNRAESTEWVGDWQFLNPANAFFQNNNSILPPFTDYIREQITAYNDEVAETGGAPKVETLIDAYSGSGLFTIVLSKLFHASIGIDISTESITYARKNARLNGVAASGDQEGEESESRGNVQFLASTAADIFAAVPTSFAPESTCVVIDPPRKGADEDFLRQLLAFGPALVVYVSCNVHTQARDVGFLLRNSPRWSADLAHKDPMSQDGDADRLDSCYDISSLRGCDFFPQTGHVEGVAVLRRRRPSAAVDEPATSSAQATA